jgi:hypothetical protein
MVRRTGGILMPKEGPLHIQAKSVKGYEFAPVILSTLKVVKEAEELDKLPQLRNTLQLLQRYDHTLRGMVLELTGWILRDKHEHETVLKDLEVPKTWWDMLVRDHFPKWWKDRWPPKSRTEHFAFEQQIRVCPHADCSWPDRRHLDFLTFENENSSVTASQATQECLVHHIPMVLCFYNRGPGDPPGNGWACPECIKEREAEGAGKAGTPGTCPCGKEYDGDGNCAACGPLLIFEVRGEMDFHQKTVLQAYSPKSLHYLAWDITHARIMPKDRQKVEGWLAFEENLKFGICTPAPLIDGGVRCPKCGIGTDTNGDGDCMFCGPISRYNRWHPPEKPKEQEKLCPMCGAMESEPHADPRCYAKGGR